MYTPMQVSEMLKIPPSTIRRYASLFADHLSPQNPGKKRSYTEADVVILQRIKELIRKFPLSEIGSHLQVIETQPAPESSLVLIPTIAKELERLDSERLAIGKELAELRSQFESDHARLDRFEAWARLPWLIRLFTPPPK